MPKVEQDQISSREFALESCWIVGKVMRMIYFSCNTLEQSLNVTAQLRIVSASAVKKSFCKVRTTLLVLFVISLAHSLFLLTPVIARIHGRWKPGTFTESYTDYGYLDTITQFLAKIIYLLWFTDIVALITLTILDSNAENSNISLATIPLGCVVLVEFRSKISSTFAIVSTHNFFVRSYKNLERKVTLNERFHLLMGR